MKKTRKQYTKEFKTQIVELVEAARPVWEVARDFEVEISCAYAWTRHVRNSDFPARTLTSVSTTKS